MKKTLLFAALLTFCGMANAQVQVVETEQNEEALSTTVSPKADDKPGTNYLIPVGTFFSGFAKACYSLTNPMLHVPPFVDLTFTDATTGATSLLWKYVNPEGEYSMFNPMLESTESSITVKYSYDTPTTIEAPVLTGTNEVGDSTTTVPKYMRVGGPSTDNATTGTKYSWFNVSPKSATGINYSSNYFTTNNANGSTNWGNKSGLSNVSVRGFAELYYKPAASYALTGVQTHFRPSVALQGDVLCEIYKVEVDANGNLSAVTELVAKQTLAKDDVEALSSTRVFTLFDKLTDADGNAIEGLTVDYPILVSIKLADDNDATSGLSAYYTSITSNIANHAYVVLNGADADGNAQKGVFYPANLNWTGGKYTRAFCIGILGSYEYLFNGAEDATDVVELAAEGDVKSLELKASQPFNDITGAPQWTVTDVEGNALPEWLTVTVSDVNETVDGELQYQYKSNVQFSAAANNVAPHSVDVKLAFLGAEYVVTVSQPAGTTGVDDITIANEEADGPVFNMMGQRVSKDAKGLLIKNGKKVLVK